VISIARELFKQQRLRLEEATVVSSGEFSNARVLTQKNISVLWEFSDNTVTQGWKEWPKRPTMRPAARHQRRESAISALLAVAL
jgi:hypothetical protein